MYGVPENLDLRPLMGASLECIGLGIHSIFFSFYPTESRPVIAINSFGGWKAFDPDGTIFDTAMKHDGRAQYDVHRLLGLTVAEYSIDAPRSFTLHFDSGHRLQIEDDSEHYESITIEPLKIYI